MKIIIIDDEPVIANGLAATVRRISPDWSVQGVYSDPEDALNNCDWDNVQLALIDISMPELNGITLCAMVRERGYDTEIVFITAHAKFEYARSALQHGALDYLLKPVSPEKLRKVLWRAEEKYRERIMRQKDESYIKANLAHLRKMFLNDLVFEEQQLEAGRMNELIRLYHLNGKRFAIYVFFSRQEKKQIRDLFKKINEEDWCLYGQEYFFILLLVCRREETELPSAVFSMLVQSGAAMRGEWVWPVKKPEHLPGEYRRLLCGLRGEGVLPEVRSDSLSPLPPESGLSPPIRQAVRYIRANFTRPLSLQAISEDIYLHPTYLSNLFKKQTGLSVVDYINYCRIERAKELLVEPQNKIYWVMEMVGFVNARYFSQIFKKYTGLTPTAYKQRVYLGNAGLNADDKQP